ncbi:MAG: MraZ N-terminal domain containing protein, partial [Myxococcales bacterium]|nr:MraZ N-terminal domain containing protein [Myxococcales bacterium]
MSRGNLSDVELSPIEGQHEHTVDDKGRLSIPSEFRAELDL